MTTAFTYDTANTKAETAGWGLDVTTITAVNREATGVTASAGELVELKVINEFIIKIRCKGLVFFDK